MNAAGQQAKAEHLVMPSVAIINAIDEPATYQNRLPINTTCLSKLQGFSAHPDSVCMTEIVGSKAFM